MCQWFNTIGKTTISTKTLVTRLHRLKFLVQKKRGEQKTNLLSEMFSLDTCTKKPPTKDFSEQQIYKNTSMSLAEDIDKINKNHSAIVQNLKRKYDSSLEKKDTQIKKTKTEIETLERKLKTQAQTISKLRYQKKILNIQKKRQSSYAIKYKENLKELQTKLLKTENMNSELNSELTLNKTLYDDALEQENKNCEEVDKLKNNLNDSQQTIDYLGSLLQDNEDIYIFDEETRTYTPAFRNVVMKVSDHNVATEHITTVINESLQLAGKKLKQIPSRKTIDNIVSEKAVITNIQVGRQLQKKSRTTLYSDETRKFGKTYNSYFISDQNKNVYMLGLREMCNKSASTTLDTFKEILGDISALCDNDLENNKISHGYHILCNIRDFMSDRAKTNIAFTDLLIQYRQQIMPDVIDGWDNLSEEEKNACAKCQ